MKQVRVHVEAQRRSILMNETRVHSELSEVDMAIAKDRVIMTDPENIRHHRMSRPTITSLSKRKKRGRSLMTIDSRDLPSLKKESHTSTVLFAVRTSSTMRLATADTTTAAGTASSGSESN